MLHESMLLSQSRANKFCQGSTSLVAVSGKSSLSSGPSRAKQLHVLRVCYCLLR